jgi:hypothetical protein
LPVNFSEKIIHVLFPGGDFGLHYGHVWNSAIQQALSFDGIGFDLCNAEPASILWCVMGFDPLR